MINSNLLNEMKNSAQSAHVAYTNFVTAYSIDKPDLVYCFFEGNEDKKYYGSRINIKYEKEFEDFTCGGRDLVLKAQELINNRPEYNRAKVLFFIDKDYSDDTTKNTMYITPCYSIENFYSAKGTLKQILQNEFSMKEKDTDFIKILNLYTTSLSSYHNKLLILNAWLSCQNDTRISTNSSTRLNINKALKSYFKTDDNMFDTNLNLKLNIFDDLEKQDILENTLFENAPKITNAIMDSKITYFNTLNKSCAFRGKFELKFLIDFLKRLKDELTKKKQVLFTKQYKCSLSFQLENAISTLTQYSSTPNCLNEFFDKHLKVA